MCGLAFGSDFKKLHINNIKLEFYGITSLNENFIHNNEISDLLKRMHQNNQYYLPNH